MRACTTGAIASSWADGLRRVQGKWLAVATSFLLSSGLGLAPLQSQAANEVYTYDNAGRLITVDHGDGRTTTYTLDPAGNRTNVKTEQAGSPGALGIVTTSATYPETQGTVSVTLRRTGGTVGQVGVTVGLGFTGSANSSDASVSPLSMTWNNGDSADKTVTVTIVNDTALEPTETFNLVVSAPTNGATLGTSSITFSITDNDSVETTPPTQPTNLAASAPAGVGSQLNLTWTASTDASGIKEYRVERCAGAGCSNFAQVAVVTTNSFNNTGLADVTSYTYRVVAVDNNNNVGSYSSNATASTRDVTGPTAPGGLNSPWWSSNRVDLSWTASTDNVGVSGYRIERCTGSGCSNFSQIATTAANVTTYSDQSLAQITLYRYRVYAVDAVPNAGAYSAVFQITTDDGTAPTVPTNLSASVISPNRIDLSWSASSDNVGVTVYDIYRNGTLVAAVPGTSYVDDVLSPATTYSYQIEARDAAMNHSGLTAVVQATTQPLPDTAPPTAPQSLNGTAVSSNQVDLNWGASTDTGGSGLAGYRLYRDGTLIANIGPVTFPAYSDTTTSGMQTYNYVVYAYDNAGNTSGASNTRTVQTTDTLAPTQPQGLSATAVNGSTVNLSWNPSTDSGGSNTFYYWIYRNGSSTSLNSIGVQHPTTTYQDTTATAGTTVTYTVVARDIAGNASPPSAQVSVNTPNSLSAAVNSTSWSWMRTGSAAARVSPSTIIVTASGGSGGFTYAWERLIQSGDDTAINVNSPSSAITSWTRSGIPTNQNASYTSHWRCKVTDSGGTFIYTPTITVTFTQNSLE
jgi:YD repeat-containing protein